MIARTTSRKRGKRSARFVQRVGVKMEFAILLQTLAYVPALASHPLLVAFIIALMPHLMLQFLPIYDRLSEIVLAPTWFSQPVVVIIFGLLALMETLPHKKLNLRSWLNEYNPPLKAGIGLLVCFALIDSVSTAPLRGLGRNTGLPYFGFDSDYGSAIGFAWSLTICVLTWVIAVIRPSLLPFATLLPADKGTRTFSEMFGWIEAVGVLVLVVLATVVPMGALALFGLIVAGQTALRKFRKTRTFSPALQHSK